MEDTAILFCSQLDRDADRHRFMVRKKCASKNSRYVQYIADFITVLWEGNFSFPPVWWNGWVLGKRCCLQRLLMICMGLMAVGKVLSPCILLFQTVNQTIWGYVSCVVELGIWLCLKGTHQMPQSLVYESPWLAPPPKKRLGRDEVQ